MLVYDVLVEMLFEVKLSVVVGVITAVDTCQVFVSLIQM